MIADSGPTTGMPPWLVNLFGTANRPGYLVAIAGQEVVGKR